MFICILVMFLLVDEGSVQFDYKDVVVDYCVICWSIGYMLGCFFFYQDLMVEENLIFFVIIFGIMIEENYEFIWDIYVQLEFFKDWWVGKLFGGMK